MGRGVWIGLAIVAVFAALMFFRGGNAAPVPAVFSDAWTLADARAASAETGRPVLVVATADWCGPCQALKRGALSDPAVETFLRASTVPVYLEEASHAAEIARLGVRAYPATLIIVNGETVARIEGGGTPGAYLDAVRTAVER